MAHARLFKWLALGLAAAGILGVLLVAAAEVSSPLLTVALVGAAVVLLLPVAAYFMFRRGRADAGGSNSKD
jgi:hypothetical protein